MADHGNISRQRALQVEQRGSGLKLSDTYFERRQPYFFDYVEDKLIEKYGVNTVRKGELEVYTTIDPRLQEVGFEVMLSALPYSEDPASAPASIQPETGYIKAMVSIASDHVSQFNLAAQGHRQPGAWTFKTFVLTTAIKQGVYLKIFTYYTSKLLDLDLPEWATGSSTPPTRDTGGRSTSSRPRSPPTTPSSPSSTSTSAPRMSPKPRN